MLPYGFRYIACSLKDTPLVSTSHMNHYIINHANHFISSYTVHTTLPFIPARSRPVQVSLGKWLLLFCDTQNKRFVRIKTKGGSRTLCEEQLQDASQLACIEHCISLYRYKPLNVRQHV
uniref:Uncharacterized protein n=1 Tax=Cacopsylla melanoneura TaxID=428564 RepID=A0A8D9B9T4_9HEMI